ncbi:unnamed protein product [Adineta steineri]|uniref:LamG-like jellyroll fold domain-containing protein n=1 Tax=Adineta steineri TaxID=433720 RepID=A0A819L2I1_9BILA|nr:unnamed protein product [Adineta steineri]
MRKISTSHGQSLCDNNTTACGTKGQESSFVSERQSMRKINTSRGQSLFDNKAIECKTKGLISPEPGQLQAQQQRLRLQRQQAQLHRLQVAQLLQTPQPLQPPPLLQTLLLPRLLRVRSIIFLMFLFLLASVLISLATSTTPYVCNFTCLNQSWISSANVLALWPFDGTFIDSTSTYNATPTNSPTFVSNGYLNQALSFNANQSQSLVTSYIPLASTSFTIDVWLYPTGFPYYADHSILGLCPVLLTNECLHLIFRDSGSGSHLHFGFYFNDCDGATIISPNNWIYVTFVFDISTMTQWIYLNGVLECFRTSSSNLLFSAGSVTIGLVPNLEGVPGDDYFQGYIDTLKISNRVKSACEILEDATLACRFPFDSTNTLVDFGPNSVSANAYSYSVLPVGHTLQAIRFNGSNSYFQASGFTQFSINDQSFSISLWIQPVSRSGTLVHMSKLSTGAGSWCLSFIGFAPNGTLIAQIYDGTAIVSIIAPTVIPLSSPYWTHIVQTWSSTNGLRLYIDNILVASEPSAVTFVASSITPNYVTLASSFSATCLTGGINISNHYVGGLDDFRIYSRELSANDVCTLYVG